MNGDGLDRLRGWYRVFWLMIVAVGAIVPFVADAGNVMPGLALVVVCGIGVVVTDRLLERPLDSATARSLAESYGLRVSMRLALALPPTMVGLVVVLKGGAWWLFYVGMAFTALEFVRADPGARSIAREQRRLDEQGCPLDLEAVLRDASPKGPG